MQDGMLDRILGDKIDDCHRALQALAPGAHNALLEFRWIPGQDI
jgi:hypothetical protein